MTEETTEKKEEKKTAKPSWVKMKKEDLEKMVVSLAKEGKSPSQIGLILRDKHGVPRAKTLGVKIKKILDEREIAYAGDKEVVNKKISTLKNHLEKNKHDYSASRSLAKRLWDVHRLSKAE